MSTIPRFGATELVSAQAVPETTVNENLRYVAQGAMHFIIKDRDLTAPPGSPAEGDCYLVAASPTGAWTGQAAKIAFLLSTGAWRFITVIEGMSAWVNDEDVLLVYNGAAWVTPSTVVGASNAQVWAGSSTAVALTPAVLYTASAPIALTSGATITPDGNNGFNFSLTIAENATLANASNFKVGQSGVIVITQDGTGSRTLAYGSNWKFPGGAPVLTTAAGAVDLLTYYVVTSSLYVCSLTKAYSS